MPTETPVLVLVAGAIGIVVVAMLGAAWFAEPRATPQGLGKFLGEARSSLRAKLPFVDRIIAHINVRVRRPGVPIEIRTEEIDAENKAQGVRAAAKQRQERVAGLRDSVDEFRKSEPGPSSDRLNELILANPIDEFRKSVPSTATHDAMDLVFMTHYFDMLRGVGVDSSRTDAVVLSSPAPRAISPTRR